MPRITYRLVDGSTRTVETPAGESIMQTAMDHGIPGILGRCGGHCNCGTCHVHVDGPWLTRLTRPSSEEAQMLLGTAAATTPGSRLGCQIRLTDALDGISVVIAERQED